MKKKLLIAILLLLAVCLTGCACEHEWTEADCLNPQICTKCEEVGADALGHDWNAATCTEPQTCVRCGEIQGEALGHNFGDWSFGETDMTHTCISCSTVESAELDWALYLDTLLPGWWEFSGMFYGEEFYSAYQVSVPGDKLLFSQGNSFTGMVNQESFTGTWELQDYQYQDEDGKSLYYFSANGEDGRTLQMLFRRSAEEDLLYIFFADDTQVILSRNDDLASAIAGTWGAEGAGTMYSLTLHEDRTVTGNLGEDFEGTWQLLPLRDTGFSYFNDSRMCGIYIRYVKDGEDCLLTASVYPPRTYGDDPVPEEFVADSITMSLDSTVLTFESMTQEDIASKKIEIDFRKRSIDIAPKVILGDWISTTVRTSYYNTQDSTEITSEEYTLCFKEDGTFTGFVDKALSGTWTYNDVSGNPSNYSYRYTLFVDRKKLDLDVRYTGRGKLNIHINQEDGYRSINLARLQPDEIDAYQIGSTLPIGEWTSLQIMQVNPNTNIMEYRVVSDLTFTIREDGSFSGTINKPLEGGWRFEEYIPNTYSHYCYILEIPGEEYRERFYINEDDQLEFNLYIDDVYTVYIFTRN